MRVQDVIHATRIPRLYIIPSSLKLAPVESMLMIPGEFELQIRSILEVADNTGAKRAATIGVIGRNQRYAGVHWISMPLSFKSDQQAMRFIRRKSRLTRNGWQENREKA